MNTIEDQIRTTLRTVADDTAVPPVPTLSPGEAPGHAPGHTPVRAIGSGGRRRRVALATAAAGLLVPVGAVGAAASGVDVPPFLERLFGMQGETVTSYELAGSLPVSGDKRLDIWQVSLSDGSECVVEDVVATSAPKDGPDVDKHGGIASMCTLAAPAGSAAEADLPFGTPILTADHGDDYSFSADAGDATRATVELPDGTRLDTVVVDGVVHGSVPKDVEGTPVLIGYDADGNEVGKERLTQLDRLRDPSVPDDAITVGVSPAPGQTEGTVSESGGPEE